MVPALEDFQGWAIFMDSDMLLRRDIADLWALRDSQYAVQVVKHDYRTVSHRKYVGSPIENDNLDYPKKNHSSLMLMNCSHPAMRVLTPNYLSTATSQHLHRFEWLDPALIGELPVVWNHLVTEYPLNDYAANVHWTLGVPGFANYADSEHSRDWHRTLIRSNEIVGEDPVELVKRAVERA